MMMMTKPTHVATSPINTDVLSPGENRPGLEADRWPPASTEIQNVQSCTPLLHMRALAETTLSFTPQLHDALSSVNSL